MAKGPSPLLGYNTNVRHKGKLYHIQTEDSGINHPHIITHLFADGGRIVASKKTSYAEYVGLDNYQAVVKKLMQEQHKAMFMALRDGIYEEGAVADAPVPDAPAAAPIDVDAFERAAARLSGGSQTSEPDAASEAVAAADATHKSPRYQSTRPAGNPSRTRAYTPASHPPRSIFGGDLVSEKSLDEVILSYLAEDLDDTEG